MEHRAEIRLRPAALVLLLLSSFLCILAFAAAAYAVVAVAVIA